MTNINRLKLSATLAQTIGAGSLLLPAQDQVANDFGKPLKVIGIKISAIAPTITPASQYIVAIGLGTTPNINSNGEVFRWDVHFDNVAGMETQIQQFIGNMHDTIFVLEPWDTELVQPKGAGTVGSSKGELYLNLSIQNLVATASIVRPKVFITLYYKL